eukprot:Amastigsp_a508808_253.p4 type:complete len:152 gc:universal Amastigsp_a508808_253:339-794(+)
MLWRSRSRSPSAKALLARLRKKRACAAQQCSTAHCLKKSNLKRFPRLFSSPRTTSSKKSKTGSTFSRCACSLFSLPSFWPRSLLQGSSSSATFCISSTLRSSSRRCSSRSLRANAESFLALSLLSVSFASSKASLTRSAKRTSAQPYTTTG